MRQAGKEGPGQLPPPPASFSAFSADHRFGMRCYYPKNREKSTCVGGGFPGACLDAQAPALPDSCTGFVGG